MRVFIEQIFMMRTSVIALLILFTFISCTEKKSSASEDNKLIKVDTSHGAYKVVSNFYTWYIDKFAKRNVFGLLPEIIQTTDSLYQLNSKEHISKLKELNYFTDNFINREKQLIKDCNKLIVENNWKADSELDFDGCDFMSHDRFVGGQGEGIDGFRIFQVKQVDESTFKVNLETLVGKREFMSLEVTVININSIFKVDEITFQ